MTYIPQSKPKPGEFEVGHELGLGWYVLDPEGNRVGPYHFNRTAACAARGHLVKQRTRASKNTIRACMTCRASFMSEGTHNRMCQHCRHAAAADTGVYGTAVPRRSLRAPK